ncbi:MAG TPA: ferredoxin [Desulfobulbaceae bacterium]|nr:ferredoxin [Desulfobulbaceae bacterium]
MNIPVVDQELCIGCGVCVELCPEVFEISDDKSWVTGPDKCGTCDCDEAAASCPVAAIELIEEQ